MFSRIFDEVRLKFDNNNNHQIRIISFILALSMEQQNIRYGPKNLSSAIIWSSSCPNIYK